MAMTKDKLLRIIAANPGWCYLYIPGNNTSALRLIYRGRDLPFIPELDAMTPDDTYPVCYRDESWGDWPDYRLDIPRSWEGPDLPGKLWRYSDD